MSLSDHAKRNKSGILNPVRNPQAETETHTKESPPKAGERSGDVVSTPGSHAGAGGRGVS